MKLFSHITELGFDGYHLLPVSLMVTDRVMLWTPNSKDINAAYDDFTQLQPGKANPLLRSGDILELVKDNRVQILGREKWLRDPKSRIGHSYKSSEWDEDFDDIIREYGVQDAQKNSDPTNYRVRFVEEEEGFKWADRILMRTSKKSQKLVESIDHLIESEQLPYGVAEKVKIHGSKEKQIRVVLRDMRNHYDAFKLCGADKTIDGSEWEKLIVTGLKDELKRDSKGHTEPVLLSDDHVLQVLDTLKSIAGEKPRNAEQIKKLIDSERGKTLREEFDKLIRVDDFTTHEILSSELRANLDKIPSYFKSLIPGGLLDRGITVLGLGFSLATFAFNAQSAMGLLVASLPVIKEHAVQKSLIPTKNYEGFRTPFILAYNRKNPTYNQMKELYERFKTMKLPG